MSPKEKPLHPAQLRLMQRILTFYFKLQNPPLFAIKKRRSEILVFFTWLLGERNVAQKNISETQTKYFVLKNYPTLLKKQIHV